MNKMKKAIIGLAVGAVAALGVVGFAACGSSEQTVEGLYNYDATHGQNTTHYGVKVSVTVKDDVITKVEIVDSEYVQLTPSWLEGEAEGALAYKNGEANLLKKYEGKAVSDILKLEVACDESGAPLKQTDEGFKAYGEDFLIGGATQSSSRLLLAVQNALEKL